MLRSAQKERCTAQVLFCRSSWLERFAAGTELCARRRRLFSSGRTKARHVRKGEERSRRAPGMLAHPGACKRLCACRSPACRIHFSSGKIGILSEEEDAEPQFVLRCLNAAKTTGCLWNVFCPDTSFSLRCSCLDSTALKLCESDCVDRICFHRE